MFFEGVLHETALDTLAAAVNEAHKPQPGAVRGGHVFLDYRLDVAGSKRVKVERLLDGNELTVHLFPAARYFLIRRRATTRPTSALPNNTSELGSGTADTSVSVSI